MEILQIFRQAKNNGGVGVIGQQPSVREYTYKIQDNKVYFYMPCGTPEVNDFITLLANKIYEKYSDKEVFNIALRTALLKLVSEDKLRHYPLGQMSLNINKLGKK